MGNVGLAETSGHWSFLHKLARDDETLLALVQEISQQGLTTRAELRKIRQETITGKERLKAILASLTPFRGKAPTTTQFFQWTGAGFALSTLSESPTSLCRS